MEHREEKNAPSLRTCCGRRGNLLSPGFFNGDSYEEKLRMTDAVTLSEPLGGMPLKGLLPLG
jgi:hypothetical protein